MNAEQKRPYRPALIDYRKDPRCPGCGKTYAACGRNGGRIDRAAPVVARQPMPWICSKVSA